MAQDVTIAGAAYAAVPGVALPLTAGGGSALFVDTADATASAADIASGMTAYVNGEKVTGTGSAGGAYEEMVRQMLENPESMTDFTDVNGAVTALGSWAFCAKAWDDDENEYYTPKFLELETVTFPAAQTIGAYAFMSNWWLSAASFPAVSYIGSSAFCGCEQLISLYLMGSSVCSLYNTGCFTSTPIAGYSYEAGCYGSIYVPASLYSAYRSAQYWSAFRSRFVSV